MISIEWFPDAACAGMGAKWWALHPDRQVEICGRCPVIDDCWAYCQTTYETWVFGTWGGMKESARRGLCAFDEIARKKPRRVSAPTGAGAELNCGGSM